MTWWCYVHFNVELIRLEELYRTLQHEKDDIMNVFQQLTGDIKIKWNESEMKWN